jgi:hypothetical protein
MTAPHRGEQDASVIADDFTTLDAPQLPKAPSGRTAGGSIAYKKLTHIGCGTRTQAMRSPAGYPIPIAQENWGMRR